MTYQIQIDDIVRQATKEEIAQIEAIRAGEAQMEADRLAALEARKAPLRRLGLSEDEINTVLGL